MPRSKSSPAKRSASHSPVVAREGILGTYWQETKNPYNAILFVLPLFVLYQLGVLGAGGVRNGVDFMTDVVIAVVKFTLVAFGTADPDGIVRASDGEVLFGYVVVNLVIGGGLVGVVWALRDKGHFQPRLWPWILVESLVYALFLARQ